MIDLHIHSYFSDGRHTPEQIVNHAQNIGLEAIAITDHDTICGSIEARPFAEQSGLELVPAVEMTTHWNGMNNIDVLAYLVDFEHGGFQDMIAGAMQDLQDRITDCCESLTRDGYSVNYAEVQKQNPRYAGGAQVIRVLIEKNYASDYASARSLLSDAWQQARPCNLKIRDAIRTICDAGGVAVLAHPNAIGETWITTDDIKPLVDAGLGGIEIYHPYMDEDARLHFMQIAEQLELAITGGSDEHGFPEGFTWLGKQPVTYDRLEILRKRTNRRQ